MQGVDRDFPNDNATFIQSAWTKYKRMDKFIKFLIGIAILYSCSNKPDSQERTKSENSTELITQSSDTKHDLKEIGIRILNGKDIDEIDSLQINQFIDSVMVKDSTERLFYFNVLNIIRKGISNETVEYIQWQMLSFSEKYPNDFFTLSDSDLEYYSKSSGEIFATQEEFPLERANNYIDNINKALDTKYSIKFETYSKGVITSIKERK
jgi:hypothetical protein